MRYATYTVPYAKTAPSKYPSTYKSSKTATDTPSKQSNSTKANTYISYPSHINLYHISECLYTRYTAQDL